jgi:hypothetical protein
LGFAQLYLVESVSEDDIYKASRIYQNPIDFSACYVGLDHHGINMGVAFQLEVLL